MCFLIPPPSSKRTGDDQRRSFCYGQKEKAPDFSDAVETGSVFFRSGPWNPPHILIANAAAVQYADELCADLTDEYEITMAVYKFMGKNFSYGWIKAGDVKAGTLKDILPDIDGSWGTGTGICQDIAAIMCAMLRSQGIHARLVIGTCGGTPHAWVTVYCHGDDGKLKSLSLDPTYYCNATA